MPGDPCERGHVAGVVRDPLTLGGAGRRGYRVDVGGVAPEVVPGSAAGMGPPFRPADHLTYFG